MQNKTFSLLQLDANLIEGEPYNHLARKKRRLNVARQNSNISELWETCFKNLPRRTASVCMGPRPVSSTQICSILHNSTVFMYCISRIFTGTIQIVKQNHIGDLFRNY